MFRFFVVLAALVSTLAFNPMGSMRTAKVQMAAEKNVAAKFLGAALIASSLVAMPVLAKDGDGAKFSIFGSRDQSSPFTNENREDPIYSPYSPYGNGEKAVYNGRKGSADEIKFWSAKFQECE